MAASTKLGIMLSGSERHTADDFGGVDSPKLKFNFGITFKFSDMINCATEGDWDRNENVYAVKQISRPAPNVLYEDVNYYNYMTKVATKVDFAIVTVTMYDDQNNRAHKIFSDYLEAISPITTSDHYARQQSVHNRGRTDGANMGPLTLQGKNSPIHAIRVFQYINESKYVIYDYLNPKIQNVALDELDMTQSDVNTITFNFMYDSVHVIEVGDFPCEGDPGSDDFILPDSSIGFGLSGEDSLTVDKEFLRNLPDQPLADSGIGVWLDQLFGFGGDGD